MPTPFEVHVTPKPGPEEDATRWAEEYTRRVRDDAAKLTRNQWRCLLGGRSDAAILYGLEFVGIEVDKIEAAPAQG